MQCTTPAHNQIVPKLVKIDKCFWPYVTRFGKRDLFAKNIILINKQLKMPYIYKTIENRMLVTFYGIIEPVFLLNYTVW